jgi:hypothetical protein
MNFNVGTLSAATWNTWFVFQSNIVRLWSLPLPVISTPVPVSVPLSVPPIGNVGVLTTLVTGSGGIVCSDWDTINTGGAGASPEQLRGIVERNGLAGALRKP